MKVRVLQHPDTKNLMRVTVNDTFVLWYSYETCIALESPTGRFMTNAKFSTTTSRHKKYIDAVLVTDEVFQQKLRDCGFN